MDYRRWSRRLEWLLVAAMIGLHAVIFCWRENPSQPSFVLTAAHDAQLLAGVVLVIGWVVLGPGRLWIRLLAAPLLVWLWFLPWNGAMQPREMTAGFIETFFCAAAVVICGMRACGLSIRKREETDGPERAAQFSLFSLVFSMTAIAAAIGLLEALRPTLSANNDNLQMVSGFTFQAMSPRGQQARQLVMVASVALAAVGGLWVMLRPGGVWLRLAALPALAAAGASYLAHVSATGESYFGPTAMNLAIAFGSVAALCGVSVLPLRVLNYRLQRAPRRAAAAGRKAKDIQQFAERAIAAGILVAIGFVGYQRLPQISRSVELTINGGWEFRVNTSNSSGLAYDYAFWSGAPYSNGKEVAPPLCALDDWIQRRSVSSFDRLIWLINGRVQPINSPWNIYTVTSEQSTPTIMLGADGAVRVEAASEEKSNEESIEQP